MIAHPNNIQEGTRPFSIGPYQFRNRLVLAPMAGISDLPFRQLCREMGAGAVTAEMTASNPKLRHTRKSQMRLADQRSPEPRIVQIVGNEARSSPVGRFAVDPSTSFSSLFGR